MKSLQKELSGRIQSDILSIEHFTKGQIGEIYKVKTSKDVYILKTSTPSDKLQIEANMIEDIHQYNIPAPKVFAVSENYLLMDYIEESKLTEHSREIAAAKVLSELHNITNESRMYGYYYDTTLGPFTQKNEQTQYNWTLFLGQMRILPMAKICYDKGKISKTMLLQIEVLCRDLYKRIDMTTINPALLHGDLWSGNILFNHNGATLIDPAIYYGDREMELAFIMMFNTFGEMFFSNYTEIHPLSNDFYEVKVPLYQLYPTLVHVALYGSAYLKSLETLLKRLNT